MACICISKFLYIQNRNLSLNSQPLYVESLYVSLYVSSYMLKCGLQEYFSESWSQHSNRHNSILQILFKTSLSMVCNCLSKFKQLQSLMVMLNLLNLHLLVCFKVYPNIAFQLRFRLIQFLPAIIYIYLLNYKFWQCYLFNLSTICS